MPTAKSYENMTVIGEPFDFNGKKWVKVSGKCKRCGGSGHYSMNASGDTTCYRCGGSGKETMEVRWYTDSQRASMDKAAEKRKAVIEVKKEERAKRFAARNAFGFGEAGYITILFGDNTVINEWAHKTIPCQAWHNTIFGWYIPSTLNHEEIPAEIHQIKLDWNAVRDEEDKTNLTMKDNDWVRNYVNSLIIIPSNSEYQGEVNSWLECDVKINSNILLEGNYGSSHMHIMEDENENIYVWTTASKNLEVGQTYHLRMKVKEHKEYKGVKQTVVYYCKIK